MYNGQLGPHLTCFITGARGTEIPPPFVKLSVYIFIFNKISLLFHLFTLIKLVRVRLHTIYIFSYY